MTVTDRDLGYADLMRRLPSLQSVSVLVGVDDEDPEIADHALWNEFGTLDGHVPERSFLRSTVDENRERYLGLQEQAVERMLNGLPPRTAYGAIGLVVVADVRRKILARIDPPNAERTIREKGSDIPLIATGALHDATRYTIEQGEERKNEARK